MAALSTSRRALLPLLLWLFTGAPLAAQVLWQLPDARGQVVLLGSIHYLEAGNSALHPAVLAAYAAADELVMELDPAELDPQAAAGLLRSMALDADGRRLPELLDPAGWREASALAGSLGIPATLLEPWKPWYAALLVTQLQLSALGFSPEHGVESQLTALAARDGKRIGGLETLAGQLSALDTLPPAVQQRFLLATLQQAGSVADAVAGIVDAWRGGDLELLADELLADLRDEPLIYEQLIVARNRHFAAEIARLGESGRSVLVVVGALHLVGADGVPALLESAGIRVTASLPDPR
jgi:uncharacterized protein